MEKPIISGFSQLAPILVQKYERYLPTAFDESMSLLEKVNKIIIHLNNVSELSSDVVEQWNEVMKWLMAEGLTESVKIKIDEMFQNGEFNEIIGGLWGDAYNYASLGQDVKSGAILNIPDIMQTVVYDKVNKCLYVSYEDQQKRFASATLIVAKLDTTGRVIGEMFFTGFGHGDGLFVDVNSAENIILNLVKNGEYKTVRLAFSNNRTYTEFSEMTVISAFNGADWKTGFNEDLSVFALINPSGDNKIRVYKRNLFSGSANLSTPDLMITTDPSARPYQGIAVGRKSIFLLTGADSNSASANMYPHKLWEYSIENGALVNSIPLQNFVSQDSSNGYTEPEGLQIVLDEYFSEVLLVGFVRGQFRQRINEIYEIGAKGTNAITRRIPKGFHMENGSVKKLIDSSTAKLEDIYEAGSYYVESAYDTPTGRKGFLNVNVSWDGTNILQEYNSSAGIAYKRWIYWTNSTKTVDPWEEAKTNANFDRSSPVNASYQTGVSTGGFFNGLRTYREATPLGHRAFMEGAFLIDSVTMPITADWTHIATVTHKPYYKVPFTVTSFSASTNNVMGYIDTDGKVYLRGSGSTGGYYTPGTVTYPIAAS